MASSSPDSERFVGRIAGVGSSSGTRVVLGMWHRSPVGRFADAMVETPSGERILLAPSQAVADIISGLYDFDTVHVTPIEASGRGRDLVVRGEALELTLTIGRVSPLGLLLRLVPTGVATSWRTAALLDPVARLLVPGARTAGSAGGGVREYYGVSDARRIVALRGRFDGVDLGSLAPLNPPVRFGFASMPSAPTLADVTTTIRRP